MPATCISRIALLATALFIDIEAQARQSRAPLGIYAKGKHNTSQQAARLGDPPVSIGMPPTKINPLPKDHLANS